MNKDIEIKNSPNYLEELKNTKEICALLLQSPHYQKMGQEGIFAIVETAKSLGIDPRLALGGGLYYVKGKVEMSSRMMASLIRQKKHSITKDSKSTDQICILHGKRSDTHDCWTESFSIEEATRAGLTGNAVWKNFPRDMLYARALSRLARQLFPDIIGNCYVEGEIELDTNIPFPKEKPSNPNLFVALSPLLDEIRELLLDRKDLEEKVLKDYRKNSLEEIDEKLLPVVKKRLETTLKLEKENAENSN